MSVPVSKTLLLKATVMCKANAELTQLESERQINIDFSSAHIVILNDVIPWYFKSVDKSHIFYPITEGFFKYIPHEGILSPYSIGLDSSFVAHLSILVADYRRNFVRTVGDKHPQSAADALHLAVLTDLADYLIDCLNEHMASLEDDAKITQDEVHVDDIAGPQSLKDALNQLSDSLDAVQAESDNCGQAPAPDSGKAVMDKLEKKLGRNIKPTDFGDALLGLLIMSSVLK